MESLERQEERDVLDRAVEHIGLEVRSHGDWYFLVNCGKNGDESRHVELEIREIGVCGSKKELLKAFLNSKYLYLPLKDEEHEIVVDGMATIEKLPAMSFSRNPFYKMGIDELRVELDLMGDDKET